LHGPLAACLFELAAGLFHALLGPLHALGGRRLLVLFRWLALLALPLLALPLLALPLLALALLALTLLALTLLALTLLALALLALVILTALPLFAAFGIFARLVSALLSLILGPVALAWVCSAAAVTVRRLVLAVIVLAAAGLAWARAGLVLAHVLGELVGFVGQAALLGCQGFEVVGARSLTSQGRLLVDKFLDAADLLLDAFSFVLDAVAAFFAQEQL
jgi:hypothetical protein